MYLAAFGVCLARAGTTLDPAVGMCLSCPSGTHAKSLTDASQGCQLCPPVGAVCPGGPYVFPDAGWWSSSAAGIDEQYSLHGCPNPKACASKLGYSRSNQTVATELCMTSPQLDVAYVQRCADGYTGILCGKCAAGLNQRLPFMCAACPAGSSAKLALAALAIVFLVYCQWGCAWACNTRAAAAPFNSNDAIKVIVFFCQSLVIIISVSAGAMELWAEHIAHLLDVVASIFTPSSFSSLYCVLGPQLADGGSTPWAFKRAVVSFLTPVVVGFGAVLLHLALKICAGPLLQWFASSYSSGTCCSSSTSSCRSCRWVPGVVRACKAAAASIAKSLSFDKQLCGECSANGRTSFFMDTLHRLPLLCVVVVQWCYPGLLRTSWGFLACMDVDGHLYWIYDMDDSIYCWRGMHLVWTCTLGVVVLLLFCIIVPSSVVAFHLWLRRTAARKDSSMQRSSIIITASQPSPAKVGGSVPAGSSKQPSSPLPLITQPPPQQQPQQQQCMMDPELSLSAAADTPGQPDDQQVDTSVSVAAVKAPFPGTTLSRLQGQGGGLSPAYSSGVLLPRSAVSARLAAIEQQYSLSTDDGLPAATTGHSTHAVSNFLFKSYRQGQGPLWEGLVIELRLVVMVLVAVFSPMLGGLYSNIALGTVLAVCMLFQAVVKPFVDLVQHHLHMVCYCCLLLNVVGGVMLHQDQDMVTGAAITWALLAVDALFLFWAVLLAVNAAFAVAGKGSVVRPGEQLCCRADRGWWVLQLKLSNSRQHVGLRIPMEHVGAWHYKE